jgi:hypothetical protein
MFRIARWQMLCVFALATISTSLYAVDGVILIEPSRVRQGNITPGDAPGFPVTIAQSGSYRLTGNLAVPDAATTAIEITADNVTLDLNGFSIIGPNVCMPNPTRCSIAGTGIGVTAVGPAGVASPAGVRVMNGTIRGDGTVAEKIYATSNGGPGIVVGAGSVIDSIATMNGNGGIIGWIVRSSMAAQNAATGIFMRPGGILSGNTAYLNGGSGIYVSNGTAAGNAANNNTGFGIDAYCPASIVGNTATANTSGNIRTSGGVCTLSDNAQ